MDCIRMWKKEKNPWWLLAFWENNEDIYWDEDDKENVVCVYICVQLSRFAVQPKLT